MAGPVRYVRRRRDACHATIHAQQPISRLEPGTTVSVRTSEPINASAANGRVYTGVIDQDVLDNTGRALIRRRSTVELVVRNDANDQRVLDLDSVVGNGQRYVLNAAANPVVTSGTGPGPTPGLSNTWASAQL